MKNHYFDQLFVGEPEYDEYGRIKDRKVPPIVWISIVGVFIYSQWKKNTSTKQIGGENNLQVDDIAAAAEAANMETSTDKVCKNVALGFFFLIIVGGSIIHVLLGADAGAYIDTWEISRHGVGLIIMLILAGLVRVVYIKQCKTDTELNLMSFMSFMSFIKFF